MDFTKNTDDTIDSLGNSTLRRYQVSGKKSIARCPKCHGKKIIYEEDTIFRCAVCNSVPLIVPQIDNIKKCPVHK